MYKCRGPAGVAKLILVFHDVNIFFVPKKAKLPLRGCVKTQPEGALWRDSHNFLHFLRLYGRRM